MYKVCSSNCHCIGGISNRCCSKAHNTSVTSWQIHGTHCTNFNKEQAPPLSPMKYNVTLPYEGFCNCPRVQEYSIYHNRYDCQRYMSSKEATAFSVVAHCIISEEKQSRLNEFSNVQPGWSIRMESVMIDTVVAQKKL